MAFIPDAQALTGSGYTGNVMMDWIAQHKTSHNIQMVVGEGDAVDTPTNAIEWTRAVANWKYVDDANIPYLVGLGNHDYATVNDADRDATLFNTNFGQTRYTGKDWWNGGFFEVGHAENAYQIITIGDATYLFLVLEFGPRQAVIDWANALLTTHSDKTVILTTHAFMYQDDERYHDGDLYDPHLYWADSHDGGDMWAELVKLHDNIILVQSGHDNPEDGSAYRMDLSDGGQPVHQALANYQSAVPLDKAALRLVVFDPANRRMSMYTWSTLDNTPRVDHMNWLLDLSYA